MPEVEVMDLPQNPVFYCDKLKKCSRFWPLQITGDDMRKGVLFQQELLRKKTRDLAANKEEYLVNSNIRVRIGLSDE